LGLHHVRYTILCSYESETDHSLHSSKWHRSILGYLKSNMDGAFFQQQQKVGCVSVIHNRNSSAVVAVENDCKIAVDAVHSRNIAVSEFEILISLWNQIAVGSDTWIKLRHNVLSETIFGSNSLTSKSFLIVSLIVFLS